jgi:hypothetical protein
LHDDPISEHQKDVRIIEKHFLDTYPQRFRFLFGSLGVMIYSLLVIAVLPKGGAFGVGWYA